MISIPEDTDRTGGERGWGEIGEEMGKRDGVDQGRDGRERRGRLLPRLQRQRGWLNHRNQGPPHMVTGFMDFSNQAKVGCGSPATTWGSGDESGISRAR
ncbi:hypothetical protein HanXRQr2_Chr03g0116481 [Helianthus annuus]|uniref:Uncharacterized protein n=1 Tax=Helianthus annuus TaxID=4232 RepID=A0A9K3NWS4_HELAN|nr:hypothetical protein HanXRQr2_Chr03g0116481 [Helianthus annuus]KAJ0593469.1 hypothetical protein HanHA300_Chr03g0097301 [Helianthus annuus]KAJ0608480.1 hypothetical protein HanHA89_Chr03g0108991 [Helianthus annuus]KAJ0768543.1 hypothetical protein HanLR1_Chr03g0102351 [Helianthus annuus]KAJ0944144.1 hypothetical protein HanPSC8_Chr03g0112871 [Helianthus annuus]